MKRADRETVAKGFKGESSRDRNRLLARSDNRFKRKEEKKKKDEEKKREEKETSRERTERPFYRALEIQPTDKRDLSNVAVRSFN